MWYQRLLIFTRIGIFDHDVNDVYIMMILFYLFECLRIITISFVDFSLVPLEEDSKNYSII